MKASLKALATQWAAILAAGLALVLGCEGRGRAPAEGPVKVVASVFPLADVARQVGGAHVAVTTLLPPGETPHDFQPKPRQVEAVAQARLLLTVGLGMDIWAQRAADASGNRDLTVLEFREAVKAEPIKVEAHGGEDQHAHTAGDPHLWLDPVLMKAYVGVLAETLARIDPGHAEDYRSRGEAYGAELEKVHAAYQQTLSTARRRAFVSFHSAFTYTAARYGLSQEAVFEAGRGGIGAKHLEEVVHFIKQHQIEVLFAEPQFPVDRMNAIARQTGATVKTLDPLGNPDVPGHDSYQALMRTNLAVLAEALECSDVWRATQPAP